MTQNRATTPPAPVALVGALDTKHAEYAFVRDRLAEHGVGSRLVDAGVLAGSGVVADVARDTVAAAGGAELDRLIADADRNSAVTAMAAGAAALLRQWVDAGEVSAVLVLGGSGAGYLMSRLAAAVPIGFPKMLISTIVAGDTRPYVQATDLMMLYPVVDLAGLNAISRPILTRAADALAGIVQAPPAPVGRADAPMIGCTMFGVTTRCVQQLHGRADNAGWELQAFHANGTGGQTLERMITDGAFAAVADITTTELADELAGGVCSAGPDRLTAAARAGVPQLVSTGALDMVNFGPRASVPERYAGRQLAEHNPAVTLMRTNPEECAELGRVLAGKLNRSTGFTEVHLPTRGFSQISTAGAPFHDPDADAALIDTLTAELDGRIPITLHDCAINDARFAEQIAQALTRALAAG